MNDGAIVFEDLTERIGPLCDESHDKPEDKDKTKKKGQ